MGKRFRCNGRKGARFTLIGLMAENGKQGWMQNRDRARLAQDRAQETTDQVRDEMTTAMAG